MRRRIAALIALLLAALLVIAGCGKSGILPGTEKAEATEALAAATAAPTEEPGPIIEPQAIADYLFEYGELPPNFITKKEAQALGWDSYRNYLSDVVPGMSIGGDRFGKLSCLVRTRLRHNIEESWQA